MRWFADYDHGRRDPCSHIVGGCTWGRRIRPATYHERATVLIAYFDESGHSSEGGFVSIAAFVAQEDLWATFNVRWNAVLERHGVPYLHATDLTNFKRIYKDWDEERRRSLAADLIDVIHSCGRIAAVGAVLSIDDYRALTEDQQARLRDPFFPLFQEVVRGTAIEALFQPSDVKVKMVFSQQDAFGPQAQQLWHLMRQTIDIRKRFDVFEFANMRSVPGLQAADLLAFELRRYYQNKVSRPDLDVRWAFRQILWQQRAYGTRYIKFFPKWYLRLQLLPWGSSILS